MPADTPTTSGGVWKKKKPPRTANGRGRTKKVLIHKKSTRYMVNPYSGRSLKINGSHAKRLMKSGELEYSEKYKNKVFNPETGRLIAANSQKAKWFLRQGYLLRMTDPSYVWLGNRKRTVNFDIDDVVDYIRRSAKNSNIHKIHNIQKKFEIGNSINEVNMIRALVKWDQYQRRQKIEKSQKAEILKVIMNT